MQLQDTLKDIDTKNLQSLQNLIDNTVWHAGVWVNPEMLVSYYVYGKSVTTQVNFLKS